MRIVFCNLVSINVLLYNVFIDWPLLPTPFRAVPLSPFCTVTAKGCLWLQPPGIDPDQHLYFRTQSQRLRLCGYSDVTSLSLNYCKCIATVYMLTYIFYRIINSTLIKKLNETIWILIYTKKCPTCPESFRLQVLHIQVTPKIMNNINIVIHTSRPLQVAQNLQPYSDRQTLLHVHFLAWPTTKKRLPGDASEVHNLTVQDVKNIRKPSPK